MQRTLLAVLALGLSTVASAHTTAICVTDNADGTTDVHLGTYHHGSTSPTATVIIDGTSYGTATSFTTLGSTYPGADSCITSSGPTATRWATINVDVGYGSHTLSSDDSSSAMYLWWSPWWSGTPTLTFGESDTDGDGIPDHEDDCPTEDPDDYYGYDVGSDGCISDLIGSGCPLASAIRDNDTDFNNMADEWGVLALGDVILSGASEGTVRVFGDGDLYSFNFGTDSLNALSYAGRGDLYARSGTFAGDVRAASVDTDITVSTGGSTTESAFNGHIASYMAALSTDFSNHNINGTTTVHSWGTVAFSGTHPMMNTFEVSGADFGASTYMTINVPAGSSAVINIDGTSVDFGPTGVTLTGVDAGGVVYNFPDATSLELDGVSVKGQVLAPKAVVDLVSGDITGTLTGDDLDGTLTQYNASFDGRACAVVDAAAAPSCSVTHTVTNSWSGGYNATVTITNSGGAGASSWDAGWTFTNGETVSSGWGGTWAQSGTAVTIDNASWNGAIASGGSVSIGYTGSGSPAALSGLTAACN